MTYNDTIGTGYYFEITASNTSLAESELSYTREQSRGQIIITNNDDESRSLHVVAGGPGIR